MLLSMAQKEFLSWALECFLLPLLCERMPLTPETDFSVFNETIHILTACH